MGPAPTPSAIAVISGTGQTGEAGSVLAQPLVIYVTSSSGAGVEGATVTFTPGATSGTVTATQVATDADGRASTIWSLGTGVGANTDTVYARVSGVNAPAVFTATVNAAAAASIEQISGNAQNGTPGQALSQPLVVVVRDRYGNPKSHVNVSWAATSGSGTISPGASTTGTDGQTSATWTIGSGGTNTATAAAAGLTGSPVSFSATVTAPGTRLAIVGGNNQTGAPSQSLALPLVVSVRTAAGAPAAGVAVTWAVSTGGGTLSHSSTPTDGQGQASIIWTLGAALGAQSLTAGVTGATGSPVTFNATAATPSGAVTLTSITPTLIVEGQAATLTGTGFSTTPSSNNVKIDGLDASVTAATATSLTIQVPGSNCQPARRAVVQVRVGGELSNVLEQDLNPAAFTSVAVGQQLLLQNPQEFCLQFAPSTEPEDYLIGIQSTSEVVSSITPVKVTAVSAPGASTGPPLQAIAGTPPTMSRMTRDMEGIELREKHNVAETERRVGEIRELSRKLPLATRIWRRGTKSASMVPPDAAVGDVLDFRIRNGSCADFTTIQAIVRLIGTRGIWLEDLDNPPDRFSDSEVQTMSDLLDTHIYDTDVEYFGEPSDIDGNDRLAIVITNQANLRSAFGYVTPTDLVPRSVCEASNEGEIYYAATPGTPFTHERIFNTTPPTIAHEFAHVIQLSRRLNLNINPFMAIWEAEGQAVLAEVINGWAVQGRAAGQNYGSNVAFNQNSSSPIDWYSYPFRQLSSYFGFNGTGTKVIGAPEECSWLESSGANEGPCVNGALVYGPPWSLMQWLSDHYGPAFPGGPQGLQTALIANSADGFENIASTTGVPIRTLLAQWASMLYADDRAPGMATKLLLPSWDLFDIYEVFLTERERLVPRSWAFASFTEAVRVRAASSAYLRISGTSRPGTSMRVRNNSDGQLPSNVQVFVVRLR